MLKKLKLYLARRRLQNAIEHEEMLRKSLQYSQECLIPALEIALERAELEFMADSFFDGKM